MDRDRRLAEMMGIKGWYCFVCERQLLPEEVTYVERCSICNTVLHDPDFSTPEWRAKLMDFCVNWKEWKKVKSFARQKWWIQYKSISEEREEDWEIYLWRNLPLLVYEYDKEKGQ